MRILGIDPGSDTGLCLLAPTESCVRLVKSPGKGVDAQAIRRAMLELKPDLVCVEKVGAMPGQGPAGTFTFGVTFGTICGICVGLQIPFITVIPLSWKKKILAGYDLTGANRNIRRKKHKNAAIDWVKKRYPSFMLIPRGCRVENDNMSDAVCIAHFAKLTEGGPEEPAPSKVVPMPARVDRGHQLRQTAAAVTVLPPLRRAAWHRTGGVPGLGRA